PPRPRETAGRRALWRSEYPDRQRDRRHVRICGGAPGEPRHPPLRDLQLRPAGLRVDPQLEVLAARALCRLWLRRALVRRNAALAEPGIALRLCRRAREGDR